MPFQAQVGSGSAMADAVVFGTINNVPGSRRGAIHSVSLRITSLVPVIH